MAAKRRTIGQAVDECIKESTEEWFRQHQGYRTREEAGAMDIRLVTVTCERQPGGFLEVFVGIVTNDRRTTTQDWYPFQLAGASGYVPSARSKPRHKGHAQKGSA